jgi:hypothetical protein
MPTIPTGTAPTGVSDAGTFVDSLFLPGTGGSPSTFNVLDGWLDGDNLDDRIVRRHIRPGSMTFAQMTGQTAHYDLLDTVAENDPDEQKNYIPGASMTFYVRRNWSLLMLTFQAVAACDGLVTTEPPNMMFRGYVDGSRYNSLTRYIRGALSAGLTERYPRNDRIFSGHVDLTGLSVGWHSFGLAVYHEIPEKQIRVRIRNVKIVGIR